MTTCRHLRASSGFVVLCATLVLSGGAAGFADAGRDPVEGTWQRQGGAGQTVVITPTKEAGSFVGRMTDRIHDLVPACVPPGAVPQPVWRLTRVSASSYFGGYDCDPTRDTFPASWTIASSGGRDTLVFKAKDPDLDKVTVLRFVRADWPPLPDALVDLEDVSNGCGPGAPSKDPRWADTSSYVKYPRTDPGGERVTVDFRQACNLHDAGYSGAKVRDPLHGYREVDFFNWTKANVDLKFLRDMQLLCDQKLAGKPGWEGALARCRGSGGDDAFGAKSRYDAVRLAGTFVRAWKERPELNGAWVGKTDSEAGWIFTQVKRTVTATWRVGTDVRGEFRGTVISFDSGSTIQGSARVTSDEKTTSGPMSMFFTPRAPDDLMVKGAGFSGAIVRS